MRKPTVFISYSRIFEEIGDEVVALAQRLRKDGVDVRLDKFTIAPPEGGARWLSGQIENVDFVLAVCSKSYKASFDGKEEDVTDRDVTLEGLLVAQLVCQGEGDRVVSVLLDASVEGDIPLLLRPSLPLPNFT